MLFHSFVPRAKKHDNLAVYPKPPGASKNQSWAVSTPALAEVPPKSTKQIPIEGPTLISYTRKTKGVALKDNGMKSFPQGKLHY